MASCGFVFQASGFSAAKAQTTTAVSTKQFAAPLYRHTKSARCRSICHNHAVFVSMTGTADPGDDSSAIAEVNNVVNSEMSSTQLPSSEASKSVSLKYPESLVLNPGFSKLAFDLRKQIKKVADKEEKLKEWMEKVRALIHEEADLIQLCSAMYLVAVMARQNKFAYKICMEELKDRQLYVTWWNCITPKIMEADDFALSNMMYSCASLKISPSAEQFDSWQTAFVAKSKLFSEQGLSNSIWAVARLGLRMSDSCYHAWTARFRLLAGYFNAQALANSMWAISTMGLKVEPAVFETWQKCFVRHAREFNTQHLCNFIFAVGNMNLKLNDECFATWIARLKIRLPKAYSIDLVHCIWGAAMVGRKFDDFTFDAWQRAFVSRLHFFRPEDLTKIIMALAKLGQPLDADAFNAWQRAFRYHQQSFKSESLCVSLLGLAKLNLKLDQGSYRSWLTAFRSNIKDLNCFELSQSVLAISSMNYELDPATLAAWDHEFGVHMQECNFSELTKAALAIAKMGKRFTPATFAAWEPLVKTKVLESTIPKDLITCLYAVHAMKYRLGDDAFRAWESMFLARITDLGTKELVSAMLLVSNLDRTLQEITMSMVQNELNERAHTGKISSQDLLHVLSSLAALSPAMKKQISDVTLCEIQLVLRKQMKSFTEEQIQTCSRCLEQFGKSLVISETSLGAQGIDLGLEFAFATGDAGLETDGYVSI